MKNLDLARDNIEEIPKPKSSGPINLALIFCWIVIIAAAVIFLIFVWIQGNRSLNRIDTLEKRLAQIEYRLDEIAKTEKSISLIDEQRTKFEISLMNRMDSLEALLDLKKRENEDMRHSEAVTGSLAKKEEIKERPEEGGKDHYHVVAADETLYRISLKYGVTVSELRRLNNIGPRSLIYIGQKLIVGKQD